MEIFSSVVLKKGFDELVNEIIPLLADCGKCEKFCCSYCRKFSVTCTWCRNERCKNYYKFENSLNILLENGSEASRQYVGNFVDDFFKVVNQSLKNTQKIKYSFKGKKRHFYRKDT